MDFAYSYGSADRLYLNVTNRCSNRCSFCVRESRSGLGNGRLTGDVEPDLDALLEAVAAHSTPALSEIVWCGFGEPTFRLDLIRRASPLFRSAGIRVRLNTNGHACLIHDRDVIPELAEVVDAVSISLNAPNVERYLELCRPDPQTVPGDHSPQHLWLAMLDFLERAPGSFASVHASVVGHVLGAAEVRACRSLVEAAECNGFWVR